MCSCALTLKIFWTIGYYEEVVSVYRRLALDQSDYRQVNFTTRQGLQSTS